MIHAGGWPGSTWLPACPAYAATGVTGSKGLECQNCTHMPTTCQLKSRSKQELSGHDSTHVVRCVLHRAPTNSCVPKVVVWASHERAPDSRRQDQAEGAQQVQRIGHRLSQHLLSLGAASCGRLLPLPGLLPPALEGPVGTLQHACSSVSGTRQELDGSAGANSQGLGGCRDQPQTVEHVSGKALVVLWQAGWESGSLHPSSNAGKPAQRPTSWCFLCWCGGTCPLHMEKDSRIAESTMSEKSTLARTRLQALARTYEHRV